MSIPLRQWDGVVSDGVKLMASMLMAQLPHRMPLSFLFGERMAAATKKKAVKKAAKKDVKETKKTAKAVTKKATGKNGEYFSVPELARHEDVSIKTIYNWILEGKIKVEKEGRLYRIPKKTYRRPENKTAKKR